MAHIDLQNNLPGIRGLMQYSPATALVLNQLAEALLRTEEGLKRWERELIATYVSHLNNCNFCQRIHGAVAAYYCGDDMVQQVKIDPGQAGIDQKMQRLLAIARAVQQLDRAGCQQAISLARSAEISDKDIHDAVLIASAFCMFNRYVDGLGTYAPDDPELYRMRAKMLVEETGYLASKPG